jgi:hypothetical protein
MTIDNAGRILVGTSSPYATSVAMSINVDSAPGSGGSIVSKTTATGDKFHLHFQNGNGGVGGIKTTGSSTAYNTSSDYRLKENLVPLTDSIERVKALQPYRFNFIADPDTTVDGFVAHEAGEVVPEAVSGEKDAMQMVEYEITPAVEEVRDDDGNIITEAVDAVMGEREIIDPQGIDQSKLVPLLTAALQTALSQIEDLTARIEVLESLPKANQV